MLSGRVALGDISLEFGNAKERFRLLTSELDALVAEEDRLLKAYHTVLAKLAGTYLPELSPESPATALEQLRDEMQLALASQVEQRRTLEEQLGELPREVSRKELSLREAERSEELAAERLDQLRVLVEGDLSADPTHDDSVREHRTLMERRSTLSARRTRLQTTATVERRRYEEDRGFRYLRERQYGEPEYAGGPLARRLDGWLARRIGYDTLDHNYRILTAGPGVMQRELRDLTDRARVLEKEIDAKETEVGRRHGLDSALAAVSQAQDELVQARNALSKSRERYERLATEIRAIDAGRGQTYEDALEKHREFLESRSTRELLEIARTTADPADDDLVQRVDTLRTKLGEVARELHPLRKKLESENRRVSSIGGLVRRASQSFSSRRSYFTEEASFSSLLGAVIEGLSDPEDFFEILSQRHRRRPLLAPGSGHEVQGLFATLSAEFDHEFSAMEVHQRGDDPDEAEIVVFDDRGRVLDRRVTRRDWSSRRGRDRDG